MTVKELRDRLDTLVEQGHGDTRVIANCNFTITQGNGEYGDYPLMYIRDVYYQSGDIEIDFYKEPVE